MNWTDFCHWAWWNNVGNSLLGVAVIGGAVKLFFDNLFKNVPAMKSNTAMEFLYNVTNSMVQTVDSIRSGKNEKITDDTGNTPSN